MITLILFSVFHLQTFAQSFEPGVWKDSSQFTVNGVPLPNDKKEECITKEQAKDVKQTITHDLKKIGCSIAKWKVTGPKLEAVLDCETDQLTAQGTVKGSFTKKSYELRGEATGMIKDIFPAEATLKLSGKRLRACGS